MDLSDTRHALSSFRKAPSRARHVPACRGVFGIGGSLAKPGPSRQAPGLHSLAKFSCSTICLFLCGFRNWPFGVLFHALPSESGNLSNRKDAGPHSIPVQVAKCNKPSELLMLSSRWERALSSIHGKTQGGFRMRHLCQRLHSN
jgi:hypothetical protein